MQYAVCNVRRIGRGSIQVSRWMEAVMKLCSFCSCIRGGANAFTTTKFRVLGLGHERKGTGGFRFVLSGVISDQGGFVARDLIG